MEKSSKRNKILLMFFSTVNFMVMTFMQVIENV